MQEASLRNGTETQVGSPTKVRKCMMEGYITPSENQVKQERRKQKIQRVNELMNFPFPQSYGLTSRKTENSSAGSLQMVTAAMKLKHGCSLEEKL